MTTDDIERAAERANREYQKLRNPYQEPTPWTEIPSDRQYPWIVTAAMFLNNPGMTPAQVRETCMEGYATWTWENVTPKYQRIWQRVWAVLRRQADLIGQQDRMAA